MAEHLRNQLAREGFILRSNSLQTLSRFINSIAGEPLEVSPAIFRLLVCQALAAMDPPEFRRVRDYPGFERAVASLINELASAGCEPYDVSGPLGGIFDHVREALCQRGLATRKDRLRAAAIAVDNNNLPGTGAILFDGFYNFAAPELDLISALASRTGVTVTLPDWEGAEPARQALLEFGFKEERLSRRRTRPVEVLVTAANIEQEVEEIARRILEQAASGRPFRQIGVVVRGYAPYVPALRTAFERFGIPARYYFPQSLSTHPAVARVTRLVDASLRGWDHRQALGALRLLPPSPALERTEFALLDEIPANGIDNLSSLAEGFGELLRDCRSTAAIKQLCAAFPPEVTDGVRHEDAFLWRSHAAAVASFLEVIDEISKVLSDRPFTHFWTEVKASLASTSFWPDDRRRNVVAVIDAYEARQWELPVVFVCGLIEGQFPRHHFENPLLGDEVRLALRSKGFRLRTSAEENAEERFLFELATSRATESLVLSWPKYNSKGDENLRTFLLEAFIKSNAPVVQPGVPVRPAPARARPPSASAAIKDPGLLEWLGLKHARLSPSAIQRFLECPFAFYADRSLKLAGWPATPAERLDPLLQGQIVHDVLAQSLRTPLMMDQIFDEIFQEACVQARVPASHRTESIRLEMLRSIQRFQREAQLSRAREILTEKEFEMGLPGGLTVRGRIDRLDVFQGGRALVVDYKYAASYRMRDYLSANEDEQSVQAGLYLLAARQVFNYEPLGLLYCTLRRDVKWNGWHVVWPGIEAIGTTCDPEYLRELVDKAAATSRAVAQSIAQGRIEPAPSDASICRRCEYSDICRVEIAAMVTVAGGATQ
jgi:ATP-dependent helicase/DNAse subunit B